MASPSQNFLDDFRLLRRVQKIYERYCREGKRPSRAEAEDWLRSLGWQPTGLANLLREWGYDR